MSRIGVRLKIDVTKIDKALLFIGQKGKYLDATVFINIDEKDQYDNNGMITQEVPEGGAKNSGAILGNCKVFWQEPSQNAPQQGLHPDQPHAKPLAQQQASCRSIFGSAPKKSSISSSHGRNSLRRWKRSGSRRARRAKRKRDGSRRFREFRGRYGRPSRLQNGKRFTAMLRRHSLPRPRPCWIRLKSYPQRSCSPGRT